MAEFAVHSKLWVFESGKRKPLISGVCFAIMRLDFGQWEHPGVGIEIVSDHVFDALEVIRHCCHKHGVCRETIPVGDGVGEVVDCFLIGGCENLSEV